MQVRQRLQNSHDRHIDSYAVFITFFVSISGLILIRHTIERPLTTLLLLFAVSIVGIILIIQLSHELNDLNIKKLCFIYILKLFFLISFFNPMWSSQLDPTLGNFDGDQNRYYFQANELAENGFSLDALPSLNYTGILFYYGILFWLLGHNPVIPAIVNTFVTLLATLLLMKVAYQIKRVRDPYGWMFGLGMIIPEVLLQDTMTSRDSLVMSLIVFAILPLAVYLIQKPGDKEISPYYVFLIVPAMLLLGIMRPVMLIPIIFSQIVLLVVFRNSIKRPIFTLSLLAIIGLIIFLVPFLLERLGSYRFDFLEMLSWISKRDDVFLDEMSWSEQSIGLLLIPNNFIEFLLFVPLRTILYLVAPLPKIGISPLGLFAGNWEDWQNLTTILSSLMYVALFPLSIVALIASLRNKIEKEALVLIVPCWSVLLAVGGGNQIIHERYRIMALLFLWGCMWLGKSSYLKCRKLVSQVYLGWGFLLSFGLVFYLMYKFF